MKLWIECICIWLHFICAFGSFLANCFAEKYTLSEKVSSERVCLSFPLAMIELYMNECYRLLFLNYTSVFPLDSFLDG
jgi:hypothetical protein